jgi:predicted nucleic acid-binding protein
MLLIDTSVVVAATNRADTHHQRCAELLRGAAGPLLMPVLTIAEAADLLERRLGRAAELGLARAVESGELVPEPVRETDWARIAALVEKYADLPLGIVDASIVAAAERLRVRSIATLDQRRFRTVRPGHVDALTLLP